MQVLLTRTIRMSSRPGWHFGWSKSVGRDTLLQSTSDHATSPSAQFSTLLAPMRNFPTCYPVKSKHLACYIFLLIDGVIHRFGACLVEHQHHLQHPQPVFHNFVSLKATSILLYFDK